jgi:alkylation response protein AidB-like acyl-CoA dehydrogenase
VTLYYAWHYVLVLAGPEPAATWRPAPGASAADAKYWLDRHWRNARTHSIHDPVDWKYHHVAAYEVNGTLPPNHGQL